MALLSNRRINNFVLIVVIQKMHTDFWSRKKDLLEDPDMGGREI